MHELTYNIITDLFFVKSLSASDHHIFWENLCSSLILGLYMSIPYILENKSKSTSIGKNKISYYISL
jgi:hypothetical protein